jgi:hypothetical protein
MRRLDRQRETQTGAQADKELNPRFHERQPTAVMNYTVVADAPPVCAAPRCSSRLTRSSPLLAQECYHTRAGRGENWVDAVASSGERRMRCGG